MAENTKIEWAHHTANYWIGCTKVSDACDFCYAERDWADRYKRVEWGPKGDRSPTKHSALRSRLGGWNHKAKLAGERHRVFVNSLSDIGDNHKSILPEWRQAIEADIRSFKHLDFLLLTKRPQNIPKLYPGMMEDWPANAWMGCTVENQEEADRRIPILANIPARFRFLSCEPLLGEIDLEYPKGVWPDGPPYCCSGWECGCMGLPTEPPLSYYLHWVITGGESGPNYRHANPDWFRSLRDQCKAADVPFLFKQWEGANQAIIKAKGRELDGVVHDGYPAI
jgi:protein gp37